MWYGLCASNNMMQAEFHRGLATFRVPMAVKWCLVCCASALLRSMRARVTAHTTSEAMHWRPCVCVQKLTFRDSSMWRTDAASWTGCAMWRA